MSWSIPILRRKTGAGICGHADKSPKTLANILSAYQQPSAIRIIHNRIQAEARRLLLYTAKSSKEIALMLGFEDQAAFSRFFKNAAGLSATEYRHQYKK